MSAYQDKLRKVIQANVRKLLDFSRVFPVPSNWRGKSRQIVVPRCVKLSYLDASNCRNKLRQFGVEQKKVIKKIDRNTRE